MEPKVIRANQFILEGENGEARAALDMDELGPRLLLKDGSGENRVGLGVPSNGKVFLGLADQNGKARIMLIVDEEGPRLMLNDQNGKARAALTVGENGPRLSMFDENGETIWSQP